MKTSNVLRDSSGMAYNLFSTNVERIPGLSIGIIYWFYYLRLSAICMCLLTGLSGYMMVHNLAGDAFGGNLTLDDTTAVLSGSELWAGVVCITSLGNRYNLSWSSSGNGTDLESFLTHAKQLDFQVMVVVYESQHMAV